MTDQRDTPDTRTPSAEGCDHDRHQSVRDSADASDVRWGHISGDFGVTPWEPCPEPAPLGDATTALTKQEREVIVGALDNFITGYDIEQGVDPAYAETARCARAKIIAGDATTGAEPTEEAHEHDWRPIIPIGVEWGAWSCACGAVKDDPAKPPPAPPEALTLERLAADLAAARTEAERLRSVVVEHESWTAQAIDERTAAEARADLAEAQVAAVRALLHPLGAEGWDLIPDEFWIHERDIRAALDTAPEDRAADV